MNPRGIHHVGLVVGTSLICIVLWGVLIGSMLPFLMSRLGLDPAASSIPFVTTIVDVTGLIIYFSIAALLLYTAGIHLRRSGSSG